MEIIVDKSFLRGAPAHQLVAILDLHQAYMPDVLFYEIFKDDEERHRLFGRLPARPNPIGLLPGTGELVRYEIEHRRSAAPLAKHVLARNYRFNPALSSDAFEMEPWMRTATEERRAFYRQAASDVIHLVELIPGIFPWVADHQPGTGALRPQFVAAKDRLSKDDGAIRMLYTEVRHHTWPGASRVTRNTALFRKVQLDCLFALSIFERYGRAPPENALSKVIDHDMRDRDYSLFATLCGAIATKDKHLAAIVRCAEPSTIIVGLGATTPTRGRG